MTRRRMIAAGRNDPSQAHDQRQPADVTPVGFHDRTAVRDTIATL